MAFKLSDLKEHNTQLLELLTIHLPDMLWVKDVQGRYIYANKAICDGLLMAKDTQEPIGKDDVFFAKRERESHPENPKWHTFGELCFNSDQVVIDNDKAMRFEEYGNVKGVMLYLEVYKAPFHDENGKVIGTVGAGRDITDLKKTQMSLETSLKQQQEQKDLLEHRATHDTLTGLPNRILLKIELEQRIAFAKMHQSGFTLLFADLDHFKEINDSLGHHIGDKVLMETARRLKAHLRSGDMLARLGGDEFCIILHDVYEPQEVESMLAHYMAAMQEALRIGSSVLHTSLSFGIAIYPHDGESVDTLMKNADAAMFKAKQDGRKIYRFYSEEMTTNAYERIILETELRKAMAEESIGLCFQPQIDASHKRMVGMEVLARWNNAQMGEVAPDRFILLAEQTGMIVELDRLIMRKALEYFTAWKREGLETGILSFNLSMKQIEDQSFLAFLQKTLESYGVSYGDIEFEVTETQIMKEPERCISTLQQISALGINIAIDDFGTGYSSLAYLKRLPIKKLKIDKSFIDHLPGDLEDVAITRTVISLSETLNLQVIAEGVESEAQKAFLLQNRCNVLQGFLCARPMTPDMMYDYLKEQAAHSIQ